MNEQQEQHGDVLAWLTDAFVGQVVPHGPDEAMKQRLIVDLERQSNHSAADYPTKLWRGWTMRKAMSVAAVLLVMVAVGGFFSTRPGGPGAAFAAMIDRIKEIRFVRFVIRSESDKSNDVPALESTITAMPPWTRQEVTVNGLKVVRITNNEQRKMLTLFESLKNAKIGKLKGGPAGVEQGNFIDKLRSLPKEGAEYLGKEQMDGVEAMKFRYQHKGDFYTLWIDPATKLPIHVFVTDTLDPSAATVKVTFSKFEWDLPVEPGLFTLEPPAGYEMSSSADQ